MQTDWSILSEADLAMLRYSIMHDMARIERGEFPAWHWQREHAMLLDVKQTTSGVEVCRHCRHDAATPNKNTPTGGEP